MELSIPMRMTQCSQITSKMSLKKSVEIGYTKYNLKDFECIKTFLPTFNHIAVVKNKSPEVRHSLCLCCTTY